MTAINQETIRAGWLTAFEKLAINDELPKEGELRFSEVQEILGLSKEKTKTAIRRMVTDGLVVTRKVRPNLVYYRLTEGQVHLQPQSRVRSQEE